MTCIIHTSYVYLFFDIQPYNSVCNGHYFHSNGLHRWHYNDVIMGKIASQITSLTIVYSTVYSDADQGKHQSSASLAFVRGIHRGPVISPHKGPVTRKMLPFDDVIMYPIFLACATSVERGFTVFTCKQHLSDGSITSTNQRQTQSSFLIIMYPDTKWLPFCRWHFQIGIIFWKSFCFSLGFVSNGPVNNMSGLIKIRARRWSCDKPNWQWMSLATSNTASM